MGCGSVEATEGEESTLDAGLDLTPVWGAKPCPESSYCLVWRWNPSAQSCESFVPSNFECHDAGTD